MINVNEQIGPPNEQTPVESVAARRRFVRGVAVVVPVVMTVGSRSAMATVGCQSPSASASISLLNSRPGRPGGSCASGRTPGFWKEAYKTHEADWLAVAGNGKLFSSVYSGGFPGKTLKEVMDLPGWADPYQFGGHLAAAWCNLQRGWVDASVLSLLVLETMWAQGNNYQPIPGVTWNKERIVTYLQSTMPM